MGSSHYLEIASVHAAIHYLCLLMKCKKQHIDWERIFLLNKFPIQAKETKLDYIWRI